MYIAGSGSKPRLANAALQDSPEEIPHIALMHFFWTIKGLFLCVLFPHITIPYRNIEAT